MEQNSPMKAIIIMLLLSCGMAVNTQSQQVDKAKEEKIPEVFKALTTPDTVSLEEMRLGFEQAERRWAQKRVSGFSTIVNAHCILTTSPLAEYSAEADGKCYGEYALWRTGHKYKDEILYLNKALDRKTGQPDIQLLTKLREQYGGPDANTIDDDDESRPLPAKAGWVNGTYVTLADPLWYYGFIVSSLMRWYHFKQGVTTDYKGRSAPDSRYQQLAGRYSSLHWLDGTWWQSERCAEQEQLISYDASRYATRIDTNHISAVYSLLVTVNGNGRAQLHVLKIHRQRPENTADIAELQKYVAELPAWSFSYLYASDGRILPGRYLTAFRGEDYWHISDDISASIRYEKRWREYQKEKRRRQFSEQ